MLGISMCAACCNCVHYDAIVFNEFVLIVDNEFHNGLLEKPYYCNYCKFSVNAQYHHTVYIILYYRMAGNFGGEFILADWRF